MLINTNSFAENKIDYNCIEIEKVAKDMGYNVSKLNNEKLELIKDGKYTYAELDKDFCSVTLVSKITKATSDKIKSLQYSSSPLGLRRKT